MPILNTPTNNVRNTPGVFQQQQARQQQQQLGQAQIQNIMSQIALRNAQTGQVGQTTADQLSDFKIAGLRALVDPNTPPEIKQRLIDTGQFGAKSENKQTSSVIKDPNDPTKSIRVRNVFDSKGGLTNQTKIGEATLAESIGGVAAEGLSRGSKSKIETQLVSLEETQKELGAIDSQFRPDFFIKLNLKDPLGDSKTSAAITATAERFGLSPDKARVRFLKDKTKFFADSKRVFLKFRKFITGVAGGLPEFREIAKASIDPENDSPTQFKAKMKSMNDSAIRLMEIMTRVRSKGFEPTKDNISAEIKNAGGLDKIPIQATPPALKPADFNPEDLDAMSPEDLQKLLETFDAGN